MVKLLKNVSKDKWLTTSGIKVVLSLFAGTGWMEATPMFYGYYDGTYTFEFEGVSFDFPLAFFLVILVIMMVNLLLIVISSAKSFYNR